MAENTGLEIVSKAAKYFATKAVIDTACAVMRDDYAIMQVASAYELRNQPKAQAMLNYYISGKGANYDVMVDTGKFFREDEGVKKKVLSEIIASIQKGAKSGSVGIKQGVYTNQEWKNTLGSINMQWQLNGKNQVQIWFVNKYRWHPNEARVSQCVHQAAENLKKQGASEFDMIGERAIINLPQTQNRIMLN